MILIVIGIILWIILPFVICEIHISKKREELEKNFILEKCESYRENAKIRELQEIIDKLNISTKSEFQGNINLFER